MGKEKYTFSPLKQTNYPGDLIPQHILSHDGNFLDFEMKEFKMSNATNMWQEDHVYGTLQALETSPFSRELIPQHYENVNSVSYDYSADENVNLPSSPSVCSEL